MFMEHFEGTLQTILIFAVLLSTILISWVVIRWAKGPSAKNRDLPKLKFRQFQALYYLNPESWTLGELRHLRRRGGISVQLLGRDSLRLLQKGSDSPEKKPGESRPN